MNFKLLLLDVDGVLVGEKIGFNSPNPHPSVINRLKNIKNKGVSISLCTAKPHKAILKIIESADLNNPHITNGGGVIINPISKNILKKHVIGKHDAIEVLRLYLKHHIYTEFYSVGDYFIQENQKSVITKTHTHILQQEPTVVPDLENAAKNQDIVKIMPISNDDEDKKRLTSLFDEFKDKLTLSWGVHPIALPHQFGIITAKGISKQEGALEIAKSLGVESHNMLGIGDSTSDWQFINICDYAGAMGNASEELKNLIKSKGDGHFFLGKHVDDNGVLDIFDYFRL